MLKKIIKGLIVILILFIIGYIIFLKIPQTSVNSKSVVAEITAEELFDAFTNDEASAQSQYLGKAVIISGSIEDKYEDETGSPVIILSGSEGSAAAMITLEAGEKDKLAKYKVGKPIRIKALCSGLLMEVTLGKGLIIE